VCIFHKNRSKIGIVSIANDQFLLATISSRRRCIPMRVCCLCLCISMSMFMSVSLFVHVSLLYLKLSMCLYCISSCLCIPPHPSQSLHHTSTPYTIYTTSTPYSLALPPSYTPHPPSSHPIHCVNSLITKMPLRFLSSPHHFL